MSPTALSGDDRLPKYRRLADLLREEIALGQRKPGDRLPAETELAETYGLAHGTVRQAIADLVSNGVLERLHGKGTFVRRPKFDRSMFRFFRFRGPGGEAVVPTSRILRRLREPAPSYVARQLRLRDGDDAIRMSRVRRLEGSPVLVEEIWLPLPRFDRFLALDDSEIGDLLYPVYDSACEQAVARAEEKLTAEVAGEDVARALSAPEGAPLIVIERLAFGYDDAPLEWRRSRGLATWFSYHAEIR